MTNDAPVFQRVRGTSMSHPPETPVTTKTKMTLTTTALPPLPPSRASHVPLPAAKAARRVLLNRVPRALRVATAFVGIVLAASVMAGIARIVVSGVKERWIEPIEYDLPYLLNLTALVDPSRVAPATALTRAARADRHSVAAAYLRLPRRCPTRPSASHLRAALASAAAGTANRHSTGWRVRAASLAARNDTLTVQLEPSGASADAAVVEFVAQRSSAFRFVLLVPPPPNMGTKALRKRNHAARRLISAASRAGRRADARVRVFHGRRGAAGADDDALVLHAASHLALQGGARGALAALTTRGEVERTSDDALSEYLAVDAFRWTVPNLVAEEAPSSAESLALGGMGHIVDSCCEFKSFGIGDGGKVICSNARNFARPPCWALSLGCGNKWSFETDVVRHTQCAVHVFDCTREFTVPPSIQDRVTLHKFCIGRNDSNDNAYRSWNDIVAIGASHSGLSNSTAPALAKLDVEGWEFPVLHDVIVNEKSLPPQMVVELHASTNFKIGDPYESRLYKSGGFGVRKETVSQLFSNLSRAGYELVHRADNPFCKHCSEVTLLHRSAAPQPE